MHTFESFALFLQRASDKAAKGQVRAAERIGALVEKRAKSLPGSYHRSVGPYPHWPQLAESTQADRARQGYPANEPLLRSGEMRDSYEHKISGSTVHVGSDNDKAVWQELGTAKIPPRPVLGPALYRSIPAITKIAGQEALQSLTGSHGEKFLPDPDKEED